MKKFRFSLTSVATVRSIRELRAREQFSHAVHEYVLAGERLQTLRARLAELEEILRSGRGKTFRAADESSFLAAYKNDTQATKSAADDVETARAAMEAARQSWLGSRRDVRVVESLEQKARASHRRASDREEQAALDDRTNALAAREIHSSV